VVDCVQTWRRQLLIEELANIAKEKLDSGEELNVIYDFLDMMIISKWKFIPSTRKQYLISVTKVLKNQNVL